MFDPRKAAARLLRVLQALVHRNEAARLAKLGSTKEIFAHHYRANAWKSDESRSGRGSTLRYTENIRKEIPKLVSTLGVRTLLDAPCGDYHWFGRMTFEPPVAYVGADIVDELVERNQAAYGSDRVRFTTLDITSDPLPAADLWLCRDCLFHLSNADIDKVVANFLRSDIRYLLTSVHTDCRENTDIPTGGFRLLNLMLDPFRFPPPAAAIDDWIEGFPRRQLALWERETLRQALAGRG